MTKEQYLRNRNNLPQNLERLLDSVKGFQGEYEYERDYVKVYEKLKNTNPFSVLVFYELSKTKAKLNILKKINPFVPERMLACIASYEQFYFVPELEELRVGNWLGSGYRSTQSTYALALARLSETHDVPTHLLVLDRQQRIRHMLSSPALIVQPHEVTQNVDKSVADGILECVYLVKP